MKNKFRYSIILIAILGVMQVTCKKPDTGISLNINADVFKYTVNIGFSDANSGDALSGVSLTMGGQDAASIYEVGGNKTYNVIGGNITLAVDPKRLITDENPVSFTVIAKAQGYLPINIAITILPTDTQSVYNINMVNLTTPPAGVSVASKTFTLVGNALPATQTLSTSNKNGKSDSCFITLPKGLKFYDSLGQITGSSVSATVVHFDNAHESSMAGFPGGDLSSDNVKNGAATESKTFFTVGFADITMTVGNRNVTNFDTGKIIVKTSFADTTLDPETGTPITSGTSLDLHSYHYQTGEWKYESTSPVQALAPGKYFISFPTSHLTTYNFGYAKTMCKKSKALTVNNNSGYAGNAKLYFIPNNYKGSLGSLKRRTISLKKGINTIYLTKAPAVSGSYAIAYSTNGLDEPIFTSSVVNLCANSATITIPAISNQTVISVKLVGTCSYDKTKKVSPSCYVFYKQQGTTKWKFLGYVNKGFIETTLLKIGTTYDFKTNFNNQLITTTQLCDKVSNFATVDMSSTSFCSQ